LADQSGAALVDSLVDPTDDWKAAHLDLKKAETRVVVKVD